jgi:hypothetical protein
MATVTESESSAKPCVLCESTVSRLSISSEVSELPLGDAPPSRSAAGKEKAERPAPRHPTDPLTPALKGHAVYRWLEQSPDFATALTAFHKHRAVPVDPHRDSLDQLDFLEEVVSWMGFCLHTAETGWRPQSVSVTRKRAAAAHANGLLRHLEHGVCLKDRSSTDLLVQLLTRLGAELSAPREGEYAGHSLERFVLTTLAKALLSRHGLKRSAVVEIVRACARLYGFNINARSVQRYARVAEGDLEVERRARKVNELVMTLTQAH